MKKILTLLISVMLVTLQSNAQTPSIEWQKGFGSSANERVVQQVKSSDGGYIIVGTTDGMEPLDGDLTGNTLFGGQDVWVLKFDANRNVLWSKIFGGSADDIVSSVDSTSDGGCIVEGTTYSNDGNFTGNHGSADVFVMKLDANGNLDVSWALNPKLLGGSEPEYGGQVKHIPGGGYIVSASTGSSSLFATDGDVTGNHRYSDNSIWFDCWLVKLDETGEKIWARCYGGNDNETNTFIENTSDGGFIMSSSTSGASFSSSFDVSGFHVSESFVTEDIWIVKLTADGDISWQRCIGGSNNDWQSPGAGILQKTDGGYLIAAISNSTDGDATGINPAGASWIINLNSMGSIESSFLENDFVTYAGPYIKKTSDGGYIAVGTTNAAYNPITTDYMVIKYNAAFTKEWTKPVGGTFYEYGIGTEETTDNGFIVFGNSNSPNGSGVSNTHNQWGTDASDVYVVKLKYFDPPTITSFSPASAPAGGTVTITGNNLGAINAVSFGDVAASSYTIVNSTTIAAIVGAGASGDVSVTNPAATATQSGFTFIPASASIAANIGSVCQNSYNNSLITFTGMNGIQPYRFIYKVNGLFQDALYTSTSSFASPDYYRYIDANLNLNLTSPITAKTGVFIYELVGVFDATGLFQTATGSVTLEVKSSSAPAPVISTQPSFTYNLCPGIITKLTSSIATGNTWSTGATTRTISVRTDGTYLVKNLNTAAGCTAVSEPVTVTYQTCNPPIGVSINSFSGTTAEVNFAQMSCGQSYELRYKLKAGGNWTKITGITSSPYTISGLTPNTGYKMQMRTVCNRNQLKFSDWTIVYVFKTAAAFTSNQNNQLLLNEPQSSFAISAAPNPVSTVTTLAIEGTTKPVTISITDMAGKVLKIYHNITDRQYKIPVSNLAKGMYLVTVTDEAYTQTLKLVKE